MDAKRDGRELAKSLYCKMGVDYSNPENVCAAGLWYHMIKSRGYTKEQQADFTASYRRKWWLLKTHTSE
jgi:hypothetical protein